MTTAFAAADPRRGFFERLAEEWDAQQPPDREERLRRLLASFAAELGAARAILEVGTGTGALIPLLREVSPAASIVSIDLAYGMLWRARRRCPHARLVQADAHALPFTPATFDRIICHNVFPHFRAKPTALRELARVLRPGGLLLILHDLGREQVNAIHQAVGGAIGGDRLPPGTELSRWLQRAGFSEPEVWDRPEGYGAIGFRSPSAADTS
ncbi:MAG: class I SAM-dependent methyltransferase [Anaerolineae bacterium]|jgi:demethylmenaquinone methyltransferase/2-methoxy-6-polyprenyl-1,4-benzoquinol methylase